MRARALSAYSSENGSLFLRQSMPVCHFWILPNGSYFECTQHKTCGRALGRSAADAFYLAVPKASLGFHVSLPL